MRRDPMIPRAFRVATRSRDTHDTFSITIERPGRGESFRFLPGQFNMLYVPGAGEVPISISGDPAVFDRVEHTIRAVGSVSGALSRLKAGDQLGVRGPFGTAWPVERAEGGDVLFVTGGIGLAPLRPAIYSVLRRRERYKRIVLLYGARTPSDILYGRDLRRWGGRSDVEVLVTVDRAEPGWKGGVGVVTDLFSGLAFSPDITTVFTCGPEVMMRFVAEELLSRGFSGERIYLSMERNMKCAVGFCGHCQYGPDFICKDGPVFAYGRVRKRMAMREV